MAYYRDLRAFLDALEAQGKLVRYSDPIDKDTELLPLLRVQQRGLSAEQRRVFLFENVVDASGRKYEMQVAAGVYGVSEQVVVLGMGCESYRQFVDQWQVALDHPIPPVLLDGGPVQEVVHVGDELKTLGLDQLPIPVEEPGFSQVIRVGLPIISRDPETGQRNAGAYNAFPRDRNRMVTGAGARTDMYRHWQKARRRGEDLPVAIVVGATPNILLAASTTFPSDVDELAVAGGFAGEPLELVPCKTVPLEVPAHAEIVIEGMVSTTTLEPRLAFAEYPGYFNVERNNLPVMRVTAITHRHDALFTPILVGYEPVETNTLTAFINSATMYHRLRFGCGLPVEEVAINWQGSGSSWVVVRLQKGGRANTWQVLQAAAAFTQLGKYFVLVDWDINPRDPEVVVWALQWRVRPEKDIHVEPGRYAGLDPSFGPTGSSRGAMGHPGTPRDYFKVLIDATMKDAYPPVALPAQPYMERAVELWNRLPGLPEPKLRPPWYGYTLGHWSEDDQQLADLIAQGDYRAVGRITAAHQSPPDAVPGADGQG